MDIHTVLADFLSRDVGRIKTGCAEVMACWDREALCALAIHIPEIQAGTAGVEWGGYFLSNAIHLQFAIERMNYARDESGCLCEMGPRYMFTDPRREQERGHVRIEETCKELRQLRVSCQHCGATYLVVEQDYHYAWWEWKALVPGAGWRPLEPSVE